MSEIIHLRIHVKLSLHLVLHNTLIPLNSLYAQIINSFSKVTAKYTIHMI